VIQFFGNFCYLAWGDASDGCVLVQCIALVFYVKAELLLTGPENRVQSVGI
jgi:hypothetical protein